MWEFEEMTTWSRAGTVVRVECKRFDVGAGYLRAVAASAVKLLDGPEDGPLCVAITFWSVQAAMRFVREQLEPRSSGDV